MSKSIPVTKIHNAIDDIEKEIESIHLKRKDLQTREDFLKGQIKTLQDLLEEAPEPQKKVGKKTSALAEEESTLEESQERARKSMKKSKTKKPAPPEEEYTIRDSENEYECGNCSWNGKTDKWVPRGRDGIMILVCPECNNILST